MDRQLRQHQDTLRGHKHHASLLISLGENALVVRDRLGHEDIETTLGTYGHLYPNTNRAVAAWEDEAHKEWVRLLADSLFANGIDATLDQYDLSLGDRLPQFMEQSIAVSDYVLIICTPSYKKIRQSQRRRRL